MEPTMTNELAADYPDRFVNAYLAKDLHSDLSFYFEPEARSIPAHSLFVGAASKMLQNCCYGTGGEQGLDGTNRIVVPEYCNSETFLIVLRHVYGPGNVKNHLTASNTLIISKVADYFELPDLERQCDEWLHSEISVSNVCIVFDQIYDLQNDLADRCLKIIQAHIKTLLENGAIMQMQDAALGRVLCLDEMDVDETQIVTAMVNWAGLKRDKQNIVKNSENLRVLLSERLKMVRFGSMTSDQFGESIRILGPSVLTKDEVFLTMQQIASTPEQMNELHNSSGYPFSSVKRRTYMEYRVTEIPTALGCTDHFYNKVCIKAAHLGREVLLTGISLFLDSDVLILEDGSNKPLEYTKTNLDIIFKNPLALNTSGNWALRVIGSKLRLLGFRDITSKIEPYACIVDQLSNKGSNYICISQFVYKISIENK